MKNGRSTMSNNEKRLYVMIATIQDGKTNQLWGYRLFNLTRLSILDVNKDSILKGINNILGVKYDEVFKGIVSTTSLGVSELPVIEYPSKRIKSKGGVLVTEVVVDDKCNEIGVVAYDTNGARGQLSLQGLKNIADNHNVAINFSVDEGSYGMYRLNLINMGVQIPRRPLDEYRRGSFRVTDTQEQKDKTGVLNQNAIPRVPVYNISKAITSSFNTNASELLMRAMNNIKLLSPYYYVLLSTVTKQPCTDEFCKTMCVSESKMYYNVGFVASLTLGELTFVLMHEVLHIAMMHVARCNKRDPRLWNVATDLYINELLLHDFDLEPGVEKEISVINPNGGTNKIALCMISTGLYFGLIGEVCNLSRDLPEAIYKRLSKDAPLSGEGKGIPQDSSGNGSPTTGQPQQGGMQEEQETSEESGKDDNENNPYDEDDDNDSTKAVQKVYMDGKALNGDCVDTMKSETGQETDDKEEASKELAKQKAQDMKTKKRMVEEKSGKDLTAGTSSAELIERIINFNLNTKTDWRKVLKNIVAEKPKKKYTLGNPNEAYMNMGITLAGRRRIGKPEKLKNIVVCIDVSGSIDDAKLSEFLSEIANIYSYYDVDGLLMYWNTSVCDFGKFSNRRDLVKVNSNWTGGTDVKCIFDFLSGKEESETHKSTPIRGKDIKAVVVLTDGYFDKNYADYAREFGRKTLWIIDGYGAMFDAAFGEVVDYGTKEE